MYFLAGRSLLVGTLHLQIRTPLHWCVANILGAMISAYEFPSVFVARGAEERTLGEKGKANKYVGGVRCSSAVGPPLPPSLSPPVIEMASKFIIPVGADCGEPYGWSQQPLRPVDISGLFPSIPNEDQVPLFILRFAYYHLSYCASNLAIGTRPHCPRAIL